MAAFKPCPHIAKRYESSLRKRPAKTGYYLALDDPYKVQIGMLTR